jgi:hypothetical protein
MIRAPKDVIAGIEAVRQTRRTNMMDRRAVQVIADQLREWFPHWFIYRGGHLVATN